MKRKIGRHFNSTDLISLVALLVALALGWNTILAMQHNYRLQERFNQLAADVEILELENTNAQYNIEYLKSDAYLELAARDKLGKAAPGEKVVNLPKSNQLKDDQLPGRRQQVSTRKSTGWRQNIGDWLRFIGGRGPS